MKEGWEYKKLEDALQKVKYTRKIQNSDYLPNGIVPVVSQEETFISGYWDNKDDAFKVDFPVVIFGDHSRVVKYVDFDFVLGADGVKILKPIDGLNARFFYHFLKWHNVPSLGYSRHYKLLKEIDVPIPPLSEQQHIVEELDLLSTIIEKKKAQLNELDNLAQSLFYEMFGDPITNEKGWEVKKLGELSEIKGRVGWKGYKKTDLRNSGPYVLGATHLGEDGSVNLDNPVYISREKYEESPEIYVNKGDVILAQRGSIGKVALVRKEIGEATINPCVLIVRPEIIQSDYLVFCFMNNQVQEYLIRINTGGVQPMITQKQVKCMNIPVPPHSLQNQFAFKIEAIEHQKELIKQSIKEVETLFNSRMDYYFN